MPFLRAEAVSKRVTSPEGELCILDDIHLEARAGESVAIVGASGSGKSTLLGLLAGLDLPSAGTVMLAGQDLGALDEDGRAALRAESVGFVFQSFQLLPSLTAVENVMLPLELADKPDAREKAAAVLERVGLEHRLRHYPRQLSGGEQQRVALARAYASEPAVLFADEPTGNLDRGTGQRIGALLFELNRERGATLVLVTHDMRLAENCERIVELDAGRVVDRANKQMSGPQAAGSTGMKSPWLRLSLRSLRREWRAGEMRVLFAALVVAVASIVAVGVFTDRMDRAMEAGATELLAADLVVVSSNPIDEAYETEAARRGVQVAHTLTTRSVVVAGEALQLAALKAVDSTYPLRGQLETSDEPFAAPVKTDAIPATGTAWADARLLSLLSIEVGDSIDVGAARLVVDKVLVFEPDRGGEVFNIAPRLLINLADLDQTGLVQPGSRVRHRTLFAGQAEAMTGMREWLNDALAPGQELQGIRDARPEVRAALTRADQFLGLAALVSVLLAGVAIGVAARRHAERHLDVAAVLRCLGASQATVERIYSSQILIVGLAGSIAGCAIGYLAQGALANLLGRMMVSELPAPGLAPLFYGLATGLVIVIGFALPPLLHLKRVPPSRVLRRDLGPMPTSSAVLYGSATATFGALVLWQARDLKLAAYVLGGGLATVIVLALMGWALVWALGSLRGRVGVSWRFGIANVARRRGGSLVQLVAFGLGIMVLLLLTLVRGDLLQSWEANLPPDAPNYFLVNVQPDAVAPVREFLAERELSTATLYPMVRARWVAHDGQPVKADDYQTPRAQRLAVREFNLSFSQDVAPGNKIVEGDWWNESSPGEAQASVEIDFARELGLSIGDTISFDIAGQSLDVEITNLRTVEWDSFRVNFFVVVSPGVLEDYPATYVTSFHLPAGKRRAIIELVRSFPTVTVIDVDALIVKVREIMDRANLGVQYVFMFTLIAGVTVLFAAIQSTQDERRYETAIMRTLGAGRSRVLASLVAEFATLGLLAGLVAAWASTAIGFVLASQIFDLQYTLNPWIWIIGAGAGAIGVAAAGLLGTRSVLNLPPMQSLRA